MKEKLNDNCPITGVLVNENAVRVGAFYTMILVVFSFYFNQPLILFFLALDFALRTFTDGTFSLLKQLSVVAVKLFSIRSKLTDAAPKKFAALLGFIFSSTVFIFYLMQLNVAAYTVGGMLIFCAFLEFAFSVCVGCSVYNQLIRFGKDNYFIGLLLLQR